MYSTIPYRRVPGVLMGTNGLGVLGFAGFGDVASSFNPVSMGISAGVGVATTVLGSWLADKRATGQQKVASTTIVNELEPMLNANKNAYLAGPRTCQDQAAALAAFDSAMQWLQSPQACGNLQLGTAGQNCINDRLRGGKFPWPVWYRDPIANDPTPQCNTTADSAEQSAVANIINTISGSNVQTNPQMFTTSTPSSSTVPSTTSSAVSNAGVTASSLLGGSVNVAGTSIPTEYLLLGGFGLALVLVVALS